MESWVLVEFTRRVRARERHSSETTFSVCMGRKLAIDVTEIVLSFETELEFNHSWHI